MPLWQLARGQAPSSEPASRAEPAQSTDPPGRDTAAAAEQEPSGGDPGPSAGPVASEAAEQAQAGEVSDGAESEHVMTGTQPALPGEALVRREPGQSSAELVSSPAAAQASVHVGLEQRSTLPEPTHGSQESAQPVPEPQLSAARRPASSPVLSLQAAAPAPAAAPHMPDSRAPSQHAAAGGSPCTAPRSLAAGVETSTRQSQPAANLDPPAAEMAPVTAQPAGPVPVQLASPVAAAVTVHAAPREHPEADAAQPGTQAAVQHLQICLAGTMQCQLQLKPALMCTERLTAQVCVCVCVCVITEAGWLLPLG